MCTSTQISPQRHPRADKENFFYTAAGGVARDVSRPPACSAETKPNQNEKGDRCPKKSTSCDVEYHTRWTDFFDQMKSRLPAPETSSEMP